MGPFPVRKLWKYQRVHWNIGASMALTMGFSWRQWWTEEPSSLDTMGYGIWTYGWWWLLWWWRSGPNNCWLPPSSSLPSSSWSSHILRPPESWIMRRNAGSRDHVVLTQRTSWQLGFLAGCQTSHLERLTQRNDYLMLKSMFCMFQLPIGISDPTMWMAELPKAARTPGPLRNWRYFGWLHSNLMASWKLGDEPPQLVFTSQHPRPSRWSLQPLPALAHVLQREKKENPLSMKVYSWEIHV